MHPFLVFTSKFCLVCFNPNCTGQDKSLPCQIWCQIPDKIFYVPEKNTYSSRNIFRIVLNFRQDVKKRYFDIYFVVFSSKVWLRCHHAKPPPSTQFYCYDRPPEGERSSIGLWSSVIGAPVNIPISFWPERTQGGCRFLSWVRSVALSKWYDVAAPFRALLHPYQIQGEINLDLEKARSKFSEPQYMTVLPDSGLIRVKSN